jgi:hypothetical protein
LEPGLERDARKEGEARREQQEWEEKEEAWEIHLEYGTPCTMTIHAGESVPE